MMTMKFKKILMYGVMFMLLALIFNVKGVNDMNNTGQTRLANKVKNELEIPNIVVEAEADWYNKLGVSPNPSWPWAKWNDILDQIFERFNYANIIVYGDALGVLYDNYYELLPNAIGKNIGYYFVGRLGIMTISIAKEIGGFSRADIVFRHMFNIQEGVPVYEYNEYSRTYVKDSYGGFVLSSWRSVSEATIYKSSVHHTGGTVFTMPTTNDTLEFEITIYNLPLLNPVMQNVKFKVVAKAYYSPEYSYNGNTFFTNFVAFKSGVDNDGNHWRIVFNGNLAVEFKFDETPEPQPMFSIIDGINSLWIQIYKKGPNDLEYTMTHREWTIGNENCYISAIRLLP